MTCSRETIESFLDDELDASARVQVESHLAECGACSELLGRLSEQQAQIRLLPYYRASDRLRGAVRARLRKERPRREWMRWGALAAAVLLVVAATWMWRRGAERNLIAQEIVSSHVRSLMGEHLVDVPSSDRHTVKPWFNGKLDFSPEVKDLATEGFPLIGGRVDYVGGRRVAVLVYGKDKHTINLYLWPTAEDGGGSTFSQNGYSVLHWTRNGMSAWAISDLPPSELERFRNLL